MNSSETPSLGFISSLFLYGIGALLLFAATRLGVPLLVDRLQVEPIVAWFVAAGFGVFLPMITIGLWLLARERPRRIATRLLMRPFDGGDWLAVLLGAAIIATTTPAIVFMLDSSGVNTFTPSFLTFEPLTPERYWVLAAWAPFFALNMLGEAFIWHSVMLPRQMRAFGSGAWIVSAAGWAFFHIALPWQIIAALAPTIVVIPYLIQRRRNVWIGVVLHVLVNGGGFLAVAFGVV